MWKHRPRTDRSATAPCRSQPAANPRAEVALEQAIAPGLFVRLLVRYPEQLESADDFSEREVQICLDFDQQTGGLQPAIGQDTP